MTKDNDKRWTAVKRRRSSSMDTINRLQNLMLDEINDSREVVREYTLTKNRVTKALLLSNDPEAHHLNRRINNCVRTRSKRSKKIADKFKTTELEAELGLVGLQQKRQFELRDNPDDYVKYDVCQSLWCQSCRKMAGNTFRKRIQTRLDRGTYQNGSLIDVGKNGGLPVWKKIRGEYRNEDLLHITGVVGICKVDQNELDKLIKRDVNRWRKVRYQLRKTPMDQERWIEAAYEVELVNWTMLRNSDDDGSEIKKKQMKQLIDHYRISDQLLLFVHFHGVTNLSRSQLKTIFQKTYFIGKDRFVKTDKDCGLYIQGLHKDKSLDENITRISSYNFKNAIRFKHNFRGRNYSAGEYFSDDELCKLITIYQKFQKRDWKGLFRSCENDWGKELYDTSELYKQSIINENDFVKRWQKTVWVVDWYGNVIVDSWNPDNLVKHSPTAKFEIKTNIKILKKQERGRTYFPHWDYPWIEIYKIDWEFVDTGNRLEFDTVTDYVKWYDKSYRKQRDKNPNLKIKYNWSNLFGFDFTIEDENFPRVIRQLRRIEEIDAATRQRFELLKQRNERKRKRLLDQQQKDEDFGLFRCMCEVEDIRLFFHFDTDEVVILERLSVVDYVSYLILMKKLVSVGWNETFNWLVGLNLNSLISQNEKSTSKRRLTLSITSK